MANTSKVSNSSINKKELPPHYLVHMEGTFYDKETSGSKNIKPYSFKIPVPLRVTANVPKKIWDEKKGTHLWVDEIRDVHINEVGIRSYLMRSGKLVDRIKKIANNFVAIREYIIAEVVPSDPAIQLPSDPAALTLPQIKRHIQVNSWPIDLKLFSTLATLREAIMNYMESPEGYITYENTYRRRNAITGAFSDQASELEEYYDSINTKEQDSHPDIIGDV